MEYEYLLFCKIEGLFAYTQFISLPLFFWNMFSKNSDCLLWSEHFLLWNIFSKNSDCLQLSEHFLLWNMFGKNSDLLQWGEHCGEELLLCI